MSNENISNPTLFVVDEKPIKFYLSEGFYDGDCMIQYLLAWTLRIETHGGIHLSEPTDDAICLVDVLYIYDIDKESMHKKYDCRFLIDSIEKNQLLDLKKYRVAELRLKNETPIDKLYDICLAEIFLKLPFLKRIEMEKVCEKWKRASNFAWNDRTQLKFYPFFENAEYFVEEEALVTRFGKHLTLLIIRRLCDSKILPIINSSCPNMKTLDLSFRTCKEEDCVGAFSNMGKLQELLISVIDGYLPCSLYSSINSLGKTVISLFLLSDKWDYRLSFPATLPKTLFVNLHHLTLKSFNLTLNCMEAIGQAINLISLNFIDCRLDQSKSIDLIFNLSNLQSLSIDKLLNNAIDDFLTKLGQSCNAWNDFSLRSYSQVTHEIIQALVQKDKLTILKKFENQRNTKYLLRLINGKKVTVEVNRWW